MTPREEAISDCRYARSLGEIALSQHIDIWTGVHAQASKVELNREEYSYFVAMNELKRKLDTDECLLTEV